jgi:serine/threonine-protein kinase RsbW
MVASRHIVELTKTPNRMALRFFSSMDRIDDVCDAVAGFLERRKNLFAPHLFPINLVMREGLTNAVRHGNKGDPGKTVDVDIKIVRDQVLKVCIADQGEGFDWRRVQDMAMSDGADHGRGMPIMKSYFNRCQYNPKGNILYLEKLLHSDV